MFISVSGTNSLRRGHEVNPRTNEMRLAGISPHAAFVVFNVPFERRFLSDDPDAIHRRAVNREVWTGDGFDMIIAALLWFKHPLKCWISMAGLQYRDNYLLIKSVVERITDNCKSLVVQNGVWIFKVRPTRTVIAIRDVEAGLASDVSNSVDSTRLNLSVSHLGIASPLWGGWIAS